MYEFKKEKGNFFSCFPFHNPKLTVKKTNFDLSLSLSFIPNFVSNAYTVLLHKNNNK